MTDIKAGTKVRIVKANPTARTKVGQVVKIVARFKYPEFYMYRIAASRAEVGGNPQWMRGGPILGADEFEVI